MWVGNREEQEVCDVERRTTSLLDLAVKFLFFTVIHVASPDCLSGVNP